MTIHTLGNILFILSICFAVVQSWVQHSIISFAARQNLGFQSLPNRRFVMSESPASGVEPKVVICGGGIIGASIAYHLTLKGEKPVVIERSKIAAAASGKAGGFLAGGWGDGSVTEALHRVSFKLHAQLAERLGIESYRRLPTLEVQGEIRSKVTSNAAKIAPWLNGMARATLMDSDTAQVTPDELTNKMMAAAVESGAEVRIGRAEGVVFEEGAGEIDQDRQVKALVVDGEQIPVKQLVVAMGPWSVLAEDWFGVPVPLEGVKSTSVVYNGNQDVAENPYACFCAEDSNGCHLEVYPRPNGEVYLCGIGGSDYVRGQRLREEGDCGRPELIEANPARRDAAHASFSGLAPSVTDAQDGPALAQACMRPCAPDALPLLGSIPTTSNAFLAAGHNCWGILWAPVTGLVMSEVLVEGQSTTVDLSPFSPHRFYTPPKNSRSPNKRGRSQQGTPVGEQW